MKVDEKCIMTSIFQILGSRWNYGIISNLSGGSLRFTELQKKMDYINSKTITTHLRDLETARIINRVVYAEVPPRVEYSLTEYGQAFLPILKSIVEWGKTLPPIQEKQGSHN